ncbi:uncharacterized protein RJT21DRAFT_58160 [Scheffersomyces amazonensis]|uniref:uncharacterized protein n=1 Tax=Scheffersomyces amazonensis TaxID=1078765 RepID=UPI00315C7211
MSNFGGFNTSYLDSLSTDNSDTIPASGSSASEITRGVPIIKREDVEDLLSRSSDVRKQLSQSFQGSGGLHVSGGINKPQSRRSSLIPNIKSNPTSDVEDDDNINNNNNNNNNNNDKKSDPGRVDLVTSKIQELLTLIPPEFFQDTVKSNKNGKPPIKQENDENEDDEDEDGNPRTSGTRDGKPNKGQILTKSLEYIEYLQKLIDDNNHAEARLKKRLKEQEDRAGLQNSQLSIGPTSGERALGEIGIGSNPALVEDYFKQVLVSSANTNRASQRRGSTIVNP